MTSQVNPNNIDGTYPVAGQDNDSQGFRDNFTNIRNNFTYIKAEVEDLQSKAVLKTALTNTTIDNNLQGNAIVGASLTSYRETYNDIGSVSGSITVDFTNGNFQKITMSGSTTLAFSFPDSASGQYSSIKLWVSNPSAGYTLTLPSTCTLGDPDTIAGLAGTSPPIITFNSAEIANNTNYLFEFFTVDKGTTIGIRDLIRNRDIDLSGLSITGNLTIDNVRSTGNVVTTNGIFWAANGNPYAPPASGSFTGNVTSTADFVATGNVWAQAGHFRTSASTVFLANTTPTTGFLLGGATQIFIGATAGTSTFAGVIKANGNIVASATTTSVDTNTGALVVKGGAAVVGVLNVGGNVVAAATTVSTSTTTGALVVAGGAGIAGVAVVGGNLVAAATTTSAAASTTTGALVVAGGVGVASNINVGGNLVTTGGRINTSNFLATVVTGQELVANVAYNTFIIDTASSATIANLWVTIPASAVNGTEMVISTLAPLTSCNVRAIGGTVKWVPTTFASAGNVAIKLIYSSTSSAWLRSA